MHNKLNANSVRVIVKHIAEKYKPLFSITRQAGILSGRRLSDTQTLDITLIAHAAITTNLLFG